jgi:hypothetical protein
MVHSGDEVIYGVQLSMSDVITYLTKYIKKIDTELYKKVKLAVENDDLKNDIKEAYNYFDDIFKELNLSIELIKPHCCLFSEDDEDFSKVYLGMCVCSNHIVQRFTLFEFETFDQYKEFYMKGIVLGEKFLQKNRDKCLEDLGKILPKSKNKPKFYSLANDCASCT